MRGSYAWWLSSSQPPRPVPRASSEPTAMPNSSRIVRQLTYFDVSSRASPMTSPPKLENLPNAASNAPGEL